MGDPPIQEGGSQGEEAPYSLMDDGFAYTVGDPCSECEDGIMVETDMGLDCDNCSFSLVDPKKFKKSDEEEEW